MVSGCGRYLASRTSDANNLQKEFQARQKAGFAVEWLGRFMALLRNQKYDKDTPDPAVRAKQALASYRGQTCGVRYAEAVWAMSPSPRDIL